MTGARRRQGQISAHLLCLLSTFALLAFASFPVAAGADSSGIQYSDAPPTATGKEGPKENPAKSSKSQNGGVSNPSNTSNSKESHSSNGESLPGSTTSKSDNVPPGSASASQNGAGQQGNQGQGSPGGASGGVQQNQQGQSAEPVTAKNDDGGGTSPLVPILIAIAVLAAISVGAVMLRQRHQRGTPAKPVSPKAS
jgi:cobalamin biosynthesis Mg chelatase CobN